MMAKLTTCKSCGKEVAKSAKACPHCGAKLRMGGYAKAFILLVIFGVLVVVAQLPAPIGDQAVALDKAPASGITLQQVQETLFREGITALQCKNLFSQKFEGKKVRWKLTVSDISEEEFPGIKRFLRTTHPMKRLLLITHPTFWELLGDKPYVCVLLKESEREKAKGLSKGQEVLVEGCIYNYKHGLGSAIYLENGVLIEPGT